MPQTQVTLDPGVILQEFEKRDDKIEHFRKVLRDVSAVYEIYYEDMTEDGLFSKQILTDLAHRWSLDMTFERKPEREKIAPPLHKAIANFEAIHLALSKSRFAWMTAV